jgi:hypothetical protein
MLLSVCVGAVVIAQAQPAMTASIVIEPARESLRYRFDNPSSFDTEHLVPHFFEQTYDTDNLWLGATLTYPMFGRSGESRLALTPQSTRRADDFDTFFQPDGNIVVTGTTGNASLRSFQITQRISTNEMWGANVGVTFGYRRDSARYHEGIGILTTTQPPSETRRVVTTRESVTSQLFDAGVFGARSWGSLRASTELVAVGVGRLAVELPDKYPGRTIVASGRYSSAMIEGAYTRAIGPVRSNFGISARASFPWSDSSAMYLRSVSLFLTLGLD